MEVEETRDSCFKWGEEEQEREPQLVHPPTPMSSAGGGWCFDCNICLDFAVEPVVTLCGHLYCWPCIYKWLHQPERPSQYCCPVCNTPLSQRDLVPLYGREHGTKRLEGVPPRPRSAPRDRAESNIDLGPPVRRHWPQNDRPRASTLRPPTGARVIRSTAGGVFEGMAMLAFPWVFGNRETSAYYSSPYDLVSQEMQVERLLHLIWVFCCCFALLCFILF